MRRLDAELDAGAELRLSKKDGIVYIDYAGGTQVVGGCLAAGDNAHEAFENAFDMDVEDDG